MKLARLLIANRGEIACRVIRTCRRLGVHTIAVHSDADRGAMHVRLADEARAIGPAPARESYLNSAAILAAARDARADAIHPGYGFLSENAAFADACAAAGLVFVGPPAAAMRAMGLKHQAKSIVSAAGVPVVPGYMGEDQSQAVLAAEASRVGFPLLVKAVAGGGGKGMRVVRDRGELDEAIRGARGEAESAFGDGRLMLERFLERPRHVEVQVFGDGHGNCVHLFERECSVQRRYQKIIEESPSPFIDAGKRAAMTAAAVRAAQAAGYVNAGTIEFIVDCGRRLLFHGNEHAPAGRAPGHRSGHRARPGGMAAPGRCRRAAAARAGSDPPAGPRHRGAHLQRGPAARIPAFGRPREPLCAPAVRSALAHRHRHRGRRRRVGPL